MQSSTSRRSLLDYIGIFILLAGIGVGEFIYWRSLKLLFKTLGAGTLVVLCGCSELRLPLGNLAPPSPTVNTLPKYYRANPAMPEQPKVYGMVDVSYRLVDWNDVASVLKEYSGKGYVPLGQCDFAAQTGAPLQQNAVDFARYLGADLVVYAIQKTAAGDTQHYIDFLAKTRKPGGRAQSWSLPVSDERDHILHDDVPRPDYRAVNS